MPRLQDQLRVVHGMQEVVDPPDLGVRQGHPPRRLPLPVLQHLRRRRDVQEPASAVLDGHHGTTSRQVRQVVRRLVGLPGPGGQVQQVHPWGRKKREGKVKNQQLRTDLACLPTLQVLQEKDKKKTSCAGHVTWTHLFRQKFGL